MDNPNIASGGSSRSFAQPLNARQIPANAAGLSSSAMNVASRATTTLASQPSTTIRAQSVPVESHVVRAMPVNPGPMGTDYKP
jgi:hypothetical protein